MCKSFTLLDMKNMVKYVSEHIVTSAVSVRSSWSRDAKRWARSTWKKIKGNPNLKLWKFYKIDASLSVLLCTYAGGERTWGPIPASVLWYLLKHSCKRSTFQETNNLSINKSKEFLVTSWFHQKKPGYPELGKKKRKESLQLQYYVKLESNIFFQMHRRVVYHILRRRKAGKRV